MGDQKIPEWVTVKVAAALVGKAQRTVYRWIDRGLLATRHDSDGRVMVLSKAVGRIALEQRRGRPRGVPTRR